MKRTAGLLILVLLWAFMSGPVMAAMPKALQQGATVDVGKNGIPVGSQEVFRPDESDTIYVWLTYERGEPGATMHSIWNFCDADNLCNDFGTSDKVKLIKEEDVAFFSYTLAQGKTWPEGKYIVNLYYNGLPYRSIVYYVR